MRENRIRENRIKIELILLGIINHLMFRWHDFFPSKLLLTVVWKRQTCSDARVGTLNNGIGRVRVHSSGS